MEGASIQLISQRHLACCEIARISWEVSRQSVGSQVNRIYGGVALLFDLSRRDERMRPMSGLDVGAIGKAAPSQVGQATRRHRWRNFVRAKSSQASMRSLSAEWASMTEAQKDAYSYAKHVEPQAVRQQCRYQDTASADWSPWGLGSEVWPVNMCAADEVSQSADLN
jgi:hypothetical protein